MPKLTPENLAEIIAERLGQVFSCSQFMTLFEDQALSSDWTLGDALAVWYSLGNLALVVSLWEAFNDEAKISRITRLCQMFLQKHGACPMRFVPNTALLSKRRKPLRSLLSMLARTEQGYSCSFPDTWAECWVHRCPLPSTAHLKMTHRMLDIRLQTPFWLRLFADCSSSSAPQLRSFSNKPRLTGFPRGSVEERG